MELLTIQWDDHNHVLTFLYWVWTATFGQFESVWATCDSKSSWYFGPLVLTVAKMNLELVCGKYAQRECAFLWDIFNMVLLPLSLLLFKEHQPAKQP